MESEHIEDVRPDPSFMKQLRAIDKRLGCVFNGTHFSITFNSDRYGTVHIWKVADERGGFRQPDQRDLDMIQGSSLERVGPGERFNLAAAYMERFQKDARDKIREDIKAMTREGHIQLAQAYRKLRGSGKGNSAFRRIEP